MSTEAGPLSDVKATAEVPPHSFSASESINASSISIEQIRVRVLSMPATPTISSVDRQFPRVFMVILQLVDHDGTLGYSCLWCLDESETALLVEAIRLLAPVVTSANGWSIPELNEVMFKRINFLGLKGVTVFGLSAFDMAFYDLVCKRQATSLSRLLGRIHDSTPTYWSGLYLGTEPEGLVQEVREQLAQGFRAFKMRVGHPDRKCDLERVSAVASEVPSNAFLALDAGQAWTADQAIRMSAALSDFSPVWLEDPILHSDYDGLQRVIAHSPIAIATGEYEYLPAGFAHLLAAGPQYLLADLQRAGGISGWMRIAEAAAERSVLLTPHLYPHIALQLVATLPNPSVLEYVSWWNPLVGYELPVRDGMIDVPDVPGIGLEVAPDAVEKYSISDWTNL